MSTKVDTTTAASSPEVTPTPSVSVAQSDANTAADVTHPPAEEGDTQEFDKRGMSESQLRAEAVSIEHLMIHFPKNPYCKACCKTRLRRKPRKRRTVPRELNGKFGSCITLDHVYAHSGEMEGMDGSMDMLVIYDLATEKIDAFPAKSKNADETHAAPQNFRGTTYVDVDYSDNSREIQQAIR